MAVTWTTTDLTGTKNGVNTVFTLPPTPDATTLRVIFNGRFLYRVGGSPGVNEYVQAGSQIVLGLAPSANDQVWALFSTTGVVLSSGSVPAASRKEFYWIVELRNKDGDLVEILQRDVSALSWEYNNIGGCGECQINLRRQFDNYGDVNLDWDIQIWRSLDPLGIQGTRLPAVLPFALGTTFTGARELRYSGFVREITPSFDELETVQLRCSGYSRQLEYLAVYDTTTNGPKRYQNMDCGAIARDLIDNYVVLGAKVRHTAALGLMQNTGVVIQDVTFNGSVSEALKTVKQTYLLGNNVKMFEAARSTDDIVNFVYLQGGNNTFYKLTNGAYQSGYQKERVLLVSSISNAVDATLWGLSYFARFGAAQPKGTLLLAATDDWIENVGTPIGLLRVFGGPTFISGTTRLPALLPIELARTLGATTDQSFRVASIAYSPTENGLQIRIQLGEKSTALADQFRNIEYQLSALRQAA